MDDREYLEVLVSRLDIPLAKVKYRRVPSQSAVVDTQSGLLGACDNEKVAKVEKKKKGKKQHKPVYTSW